MLAKVSRLHQILLADPHFNKGLPFLATKEGNSGFMVSGDIASAAEVHGARSLAHLVLPDNFSTSNGQEDLTSSAALSGQLTLQLLDSLEKLYALQLMQAMEGVRQQIEKGHQLAPRIRRLYDTLRPRIPVTDSDLADRSLAYVACLRLIQSGELEQEYAKVLTRTLKSKL